MGNAGSFRCLGSYWAILLLLGRAEQNELSHHCGKLGRKVSLYSANNTGIAIKE